MHSSLGTPLVALSRLPASPALRPRKSPSAESHWPAAPSLSQSVRIPRSPAFFPTRPCPLAGPDPIPSSFPSAPAHHPPPAGAPRPSAASKQNPPSSRPARPGCSSQPLRVLCTPPHQYCQSLPLCSPQSVVLAPPATTRRPLFPLQADQALLILHARQHFLSRRPLRPLPVLHVAAFLQDLPCRFKQPVCRQHSRFGH